MYTQTNDHPRCRPLASRVVVFRIPLSVNARQTAAHDSRSLMPAPRVGKTVCKTSGNFQILGTLSLIILSLRIPQRAVSSFGVQKQFVMSSLLNNASAFHNQYPITKLTRRQSVRYKNHRFVLIFRVYSLINHRFGYGSQ